MQRIYINVLVIIVTIAAACKKNNSTTNDPNNVPGLPPATQSGANTFGCLVNGVPWVPQGYGGSSPNLSIDYDPSFNNGIFGIAAYRKTITDNTYISIGIGDSIRLISAPYTFNIGFKKLGGAYFVDSFYCQRMSTDSLHKISGFITISKLDRSKNIISGSFECQLFNPNCGDTIKITNGRFDFKF